MKNKSDVFLYNIGDINFQFWLHLEFTYIQASYNINSEYVLMWYNHFY